MDNPQEKSLGELFTEKLMPKLEVAADKNLKAARTAGFKKIKEKIRAGGEMRMSNFVLWQAAYAELYFSPKLWPDFTEEDLDIALAEFDKRSRRFGK